MQLISFSDARLGNRARREIFEPKYPNVVFRPGVFAIEDLVFCSTTVDVRTMIPGKPYVVYRDTRENIGLPRANDRLMQMIAKRSNRFGHLLASTYSLSYVPGRSRPVYKVGNSPTFSIDDVAIAVVTVNKSGECALRALAVAHPNGSYSCTLPFDEDLMTINIGKMTSSVGKVISIRLLETGAIPTAAFAGTDFMTSRRAF